MPAPEILYYAGIPHGTLRDTTMFSVNLGNSRTVRVYLPPNYDPAGPPYPLMLFHDGLEYVTLAQANNVLDYLTSHQRIVPVIGVFVPPVNRTEEYAGSKMDEFSLFIVNELLPYIESRYNVRKDAASRAVLGASNGGNISLWLGLNYPQVFGNVAAQSSNVISSISSGFQYGAKLDLRLYLDLGTYDIAVLIPLVRNLAGILAWKGYDYRYVEYHEGHSWGNWRAHIDNALEMFFPAPPAAVDEGGLDRREATLLQNYPNPFNPKTEIALDLPAPGWVRLVYELTKLLWPKEVERVLSKMCIGTTLHICCGMSRIGDVRLDLFQSGVDVKANMTRLPFPDRSFNTVLIDPPYNSKLQVMHDMLSELSRVAMDRIIFQHWFCPVDKLGRYRKAHRFELSHLYNWMRGLILAGCRSSVYSIV